MKRFFIGTFVFMGFAVLSSAIVVNAAVKKTPVKVVKKPVHHVVVRRRPTAECEDGTSIYTTRRAGACAGHDGVMQWF